MFDWTHAQMHMGKIPRTHNVFKYRALRDLVCARGLRLCVTRLDIVLPLCEHWIIENNIQNINVFVNGIMNRIVVCKLF